jgi:hypothetical protein
MYHFVVDFYLPGRDRRLTVTLYLADTIYLRLTMEISSVYYRSMLYHDITDCIITITISHSFLCSYVEIFANFRREYGG